MADALASPDDVILLWPAASDDRWRTQELINRVSARLRAKRPAVDARIARYEADATDPGGYDPVNVASVVASVVARFLANPSGGVSTTGSETIGPYSTSQTTSFVSRYASSAGSSGGLDVTDADLAQLDPPPSAQSRFGSIRVRPAMAPWPRGDLGAPYETVGQNGEFIPAPASDTFL